MSSGPSTFKKTDVRRAISAVRSAGCEISGVQIGPDGTITIKIGAPAPAPANDTPEPDDYWEKKLAS
jgi:hypothetical protein